MESARRRGYVRERGVMSKAVASLVSMVLACLVPLVFLAGLFVLVVAGSALVGGPSFRLGGADDLGRPPDYRTGADESRLP